MTSWVVGDIHGCAAELAELLERIDPGPDDRVISVGDLFHRGPDSSGVIDQLERVGATFILGNHEYQVLARCGLAPSSPSPDDRPPLREEFPPLDDEDLAGDGNRPLTVEPGDRARVLRYLQTHSGLYLRSADVPGAGPTADGRDWIVVHAGLDASRPLETQRVETLLRARRLSARGSPFWYERYGGPELVLFGHTPGRIPRAHRAGGRLVALGLDTGCVYGGRLTAYSPELDEFESVAAQRKYASV